MDDDGGSSASPASPDRTAPARPPSSGPGSLSSSAAPPDALRLGVGPDASASLPSRLNLETAHDEPSPVTPPDVLKQRREARPKRSILKRPTPTTSRFNFKRDILQPINSRFAYPADQPATPAASSPSASFSWRHALGRWATTPAAPDAGAKPTDETPSPTDAAVASSSPPTSAASTPTSTLLSVAPLKSVSFTMSTLTVVYPINATGHLPPAEEAPTRQRVEREFRKMVLDRKRMPNLVKGVQDVPGEGGWTGADLERLYNECCRTREEQGIPAVRLALQENPGSPPRSLNLAHQTIPLGAALALSDLLSVDWGLRKLVLEDTGIDDDALKAIVHALLISASLPTLSLASNRRIRSRGWRLVAVLVSKASRLTFLDLSDNNIDKRTIEWLIQALLASVVPTRSGANSPLSASGRSTSSRSEADGISSPLFDERLDAFLPKAPLLRSDSAASRTSALASLKLDSCGLRNQALEALAHGIRMSGIKHISLRRNRISPLGAVAVAVMMRDYTIVGEDAGAMMNSPIMPASSSNQDIGANGYNSVTLKSRQTGAIMTRPVIQADTSEEFEEDASFGAERKTLLGDRWQPSGVRQKLQKEIDTLPRVGSLLTLDIKGNEIRGGIIYIAQVLKRNRTLRVLNLSENKIEPPGLAAIAEALRFNSTLETLDISRNPCAGPLAEGVSALRIALSSNTSLMRVFLNSTGLTSEGAISLAEVLPDVTSLIHLDLTENFEIDIAGVMALSAAVRLNSSLRCLDLNIPLNDPDFARLSQEILQSCVRNTEAAQEIATARGLKSTISAPIHLSAVARNLEESRANGARRRRSSSTVGTLLSAAQSTHDLLHELVLAAEERQRNGQPIASEAMLDVENEARVALSQIKEALPAIKPTERKDRLATLKDDLECLSDRARQLSSSTFAVTPQTTPSRPSIVTTGPPAEKAPSNCVTLDPTSPAFSITDSDDEVSSSESDESSSPPQSRPLDTSMSISTAGLTPQISVETGGWAAFANSSAPRSPVESASRNLTLEEGEVFRRKTILDAQADSSGSDENEDKATHERDASGEELRKEILEAKVPETERLSPRTFPSSPPISPRVGILTNPDLPFNDS